MDLQPQIIYEDNHLIAAYKPNGLLTQGDITGDLCLIDWIKSYIKIQYDKPGDVFLAMLHRLDRPVSGVVLFARTSKGASRMNVLFQNREIEKCYYAIVERRPPEFNGTLTNFVDRIEGKNKVVILDGKSRRHPEAKLAKLRYEVSAEISGYTLLKIHLETGRRHQIRAQLAHIGLPIRGDRKYGGSRIREFDGIYLHAHSLSFQHPVKKEQKRIESTPPKDPIWNLFKDYTSPSD